jgi:hypothetical protein
MAAPVGRSRCFLRVVCCSAVPAGQTALRQKQGVLKRIYLTVTFPSLDILNPRTLRVMELCFGTYSVKFPAALFPATAAMAREVV